jgi:hypothetical protein
MEQSPSWEADGHSATQEITPFHGNRTFITVFTRARHWSLFWTRWIQSTPSHPITLRYILILSFHLRLDLPCGHFPSGFPTKILYAFLVSPMCITCRTHLIFLDFISLIILGKSYKVLSSSLCNLLQPSAISFVPLRAKYSLQHNSIVTTLKHQKKKIYAYAIVRLL